MTLSTAGRAAMPSTMPAMPAEARMLVPSARTSGNVTSMAAAARTTMMTVRMRSGSRPGSGPARLPSPWAPRRPRSRSDSSRTEMSAMNSQPKLTMMSRVAAWRTAGPGRVEVEQRLHDPSQEDGQEQEERPGGVAGDRRRQRAAPLAGVVQRDQAKHGGQGEPEHHCAEQDPGFGAIDGRHRRECGSATGSHRPGRGDLLVRHGTPPVLGAGRAARARLGAATVEASGSASRRTAVDSPRENHPKCKNPQSRATSVTLVLAPPGAGRDGRR